jgi:hypothetical protein
MANVTASYNWASGETVTPTKLNTTAAPTVVVADNEITTAKILDGNVTTAKILDGNVTTAKIADANVTNAKLATGIDASKLTTGTLPIARIADAAVTQAKLETAVLPIGVGQTWQNVSSSRLAATNYTNTTGRPIVVNICVQVNETANTADIVVDSVTVARCATISALGANNREQMTMTAIVPSGSVYRLTSNGAERQLWAELR